MRKKPVEPDEMRMPAEKFDEIMRRALEAPAQIKNEAESVNHWRKTEPKVSRDKR